MRWMRWWGGMGLQVGGSYEQRVVGEYLREVEERSKAMINAFETSQTPIVKT